MLKEIKLKPFFILILLVSIFLVSSVGYAASDKIIIRVGGVFPESHPVGQGLDIFKEKLEAAAPNVEVRIFHNSTLGSERVMAEGVKTGELEMLSSGSPGLGVFVPVTDILELPYLYETKEDALKVWDKLIPILNVRTLPQNIRLLGAFDEGTRSIISTKPIRNINDLRNLKLRIPETPLYIGMVNALGADPIAVAFPEIYTALQTGVVQGMEGSTATIWDSKFYEPCKYLSLTEHIRCAQFLFINNEFYDKLPIDIKESLLIAATEAFEEQRKISIQAEKECLQKISEKGIEIIEVQDKKPFIEAVQDSNMKYAEKFGNEGNKLLNLMKALLTK